MFPGGGISIKLLKRTADFSATGRCAILGSSLHHNIKLLLPKKSPIFLEQTKREREQCKGIDLHCTLLLRAYYSGRN
jgi:hypothetical protein